MKTKSHAARFAVLVFAVLALGACAAVPAVDPVKAGQTVRLPSSPQSGANASVDRRANRRVLNVAYSPQGAVAVTSSAPPTVEQLPSGLFRVTFQLEASAAR